jgi:hypothetical protein
MSDDRRSDRPPDQEPSTGTEPIAGISARLAEADPDVVGPVQVLSSHPTADGGVSATVSVSRLWPVASEDDAEPELEGVSVAIPVTADVVLDREGVLTSGDLPEPDVTSVREARSYVRSLVASGAVRGMPAPPGTRVRRGPPMAGGPSGRQTHELVTDADGRRIIRRIGFDIGGAGRQSGASGQSSAT